MTPYTLRLRADHTVSLNLPDDLCQADVSRLVRWLRALPLDEPPGPELASRTWAAITRPQEAAPEPTPTPAAPAPAAPAPPPAPPVKLASARPPINGNQDRDAKILKLYETSTREEIAEQLGITQSAVGSVIQRARARGVVIPSHRKLALVEAQLAASPAAARRHSRKPQHERDAKIVEACRTASQSDVAAKLGLSVSIVRNVMFRAKKKGAKTPPPTPKPASQPVVKAKAPARPAEPVTRPRSALPSPPVRRACRSCTALFTQPTVAGHTVLDCPACRRAKSEEIESSVRAAHDPILDDLPLVQEHRH